MIGELLSRARFESELPAAISGKHPVAASLHAAPASSIIFCCVVEEKLAGGIRTFRRRGRSRPQSGSPSLLRRHLVARGATGAHCPSRAASTKKGRRSYAQHRSLRTVIANHRGSVFRFHSLQISSIS